MDLHLFPKINASLNACAFFCLLCGFRAIKQGNRDLHKKFMVAALIASAVFLCSYITYHILSPGPTKYQGEGTLRIVYFTILLTHTPLVTLIVPFCILAVWHAIKGNFEKHVRITRWLFPTWIYVSVTGVLIYLMLYVL